METEIDMKSPNQIIKKLWELKKQLDIEKENIADNKETVIKNQAYLRGAINAILWVLECESVI